MSGRYFLGVDGGQSSTTALIGDESGRVIGVGRGGPCNHVQASEGRAKFVGAMTACLGEFLGTRFEAACLGFSGGPADKELILREMLAVDRMSVTHDGLIALSGAMAGEAGIIVIAGTGSIAFGRNAEGRTARAGGWGYLFGDEGGGFDLTRQAVRASLRFEEGWGPPTVLREMLLAETGDRDANEVMHRFYTAEYPRPRVAGYSRMVDEAAGLGDGVAGKILNDAAYRLSETAIAVHGQLFEGTAVVAPIGGVFQSARLRLKFGQILELTERFEVREPVYGPAAGALIEAYRLAGVRCRLTNVPESEK